MSKFLDFPGRIGLDTFTVDGEVIEVSTVPLRVGIYDEGYETMVFGGPHDQECERYSTEEAAAAGHQEVVRAVKEGTWHEL